MSLKSVPNSAKIQPMSRAGFDSLLSESFITTLSLGAGGSNRNGSITGHLHHKARFTIASDEHFNNRSWLCWRFFASPQLHRYLSPPHLSSCHFSFQTTTLSNNLCNSSNVHNSDRSFYGQILADENLNYDEEHCWDDIVFSFALHLKSRPGTL